MTGKKPWYPGEIWTSKLVNRCRMLVPQMAWQPRALHPAYELPAASCWKKCLSLNQRQRSEKSEMPPLDEWWPFFLLIGYDVMMWFIEQLIIILGGCWHLSLSGFPTWSGEVILRYSNMACWKIHHFYSWFSHYNFHLHRVFTCDVWLLEGRWAYLILFAHPIYEWITV